MADDLLPLLGHNMNNGGDESDSDSEMEEDVEVDLVVSRDSDSGSEDGDNEGNTNNSGNFTSRCRGSSSSTSLREIKVNFDRNLPGTHSYLGSDLEDVSGRTVHEEGSVVTLPLLAMPGIVLVPGQTLPLQLFHPRMVAAIKVATDRDKTFGIVTFRYTNGGETSMCSTGTTAEIFSIKDETEDRTQISTMRVLARGRQRFEVISTRGELTGVLMGRVRILPECVMPDVMAGARPPSHYRLCFPAEDQAERQLLHTAVDRQGRVLASVRLKRPRLDRLASAHYTPWPSWVYRMYDGESLVERVQTELRSWNTSLQRANIPSNPIELSYWIIQNFPLNEDMRLYLLKLNSAIQRLRCSLGLMQKCSNLHCTSCGLEIASKSDVFSMSVDGPSGAYVNPGGYVHETLTVYKTQNLNLVGSPSTENSWFPGYAWTIVQCRGCSSHMGWRFTASKRSLSPQKFWGLCRPALVPRVDVSPDDSEAPLLI